MKKYQRLTLVKIANKYSDFTFNFKIRKRRNKGEIIYDTD